MKVRRSAAIYYAVQGLAVIAWWVTLYSSPSVRAYFVFENSSVTSLLAFWLPDLSFMALGSLVTAWLCVQDSEYRQIAAWFVAGATSYAAIYCLAFAVMTDSGWLGVTLMIPSMIWSGVFAVGMSFEKTMFRPASETAVSWIVLKTLVQIFVVWSIILVVLPYLIATVERRLGIVTVQFTFQRPLAVILFVAISSVGVWASVVMSRIGKGTPLPLDHATKLVIVGPYAYVRNPMAVSGIGQGMMVALFLGSPLVALYALMGSLIWQLIFRPLEEDDLRARFGTEFEKYCEAVKCWIPRSSPFRS